MNGVNKKQLDDEAKTNPHGFIGDTAKFRLWVMLQFEALNGSIQDPDKCPVGRKLNWTIGVAVGAPAFLLALVALMKVLMK
jgi:hypothetical protein